MKKSLLATGLAIALLAACSKTPEATPPPAPELGAFGLDLTSGDATVKPGDDFYLYATGTWQKTYQLRDDQTRFGSFDKLRERSEDHVKAIIEELSASEAASGSVEQKIRDYYNSYMNVEARNAKGIAPLQPLLSKIAAIEDIDQLTAAFGSAFTDGTNSPLGGGIGIDRKNPDRHLLSLGHGGLGLPDKDFYFNPADRFQTIRAAYVAHIERMLGFAGYDSERAKTAAAAIMKLETAIAEQHWDRTERRDRDKTYNLMKFAELSEVFPGYNWQLHFNSAGISELPEEVNMSTPSAISPIIKVINDTPVAVWRDYLSFHAIENHAGLLTEEIDQANFEFSGKILSGQQAQRDLWKRGVGATSSALGEAIGQIYVAKHFPAEAKAQMNDLVENLRKALRQNVENLDWMGADTKAEAYKKLESFRPKIGYPDKWRDYSGLTIVADDLIANAIASRNFEIADQLSRLNKPTDKDEWFMTPQTVNAYYNSSFNEIVFPAAILQAPFFDMGADPAVNYGAIGGVIGHEMGHGFDDQGSKSDWAGVQRNWWTDEDRARFEKRTSTLGAQYDQYCPIEGHCVNGQLAMGENIGDLGGLSMAYTAYKMSLNGEEAPVIDGLTGDQRFFLAWAQVWQSKYRDEAMINQVKTGPHSPPHYRVNGPRRNMEEWYKAFDIQPTDALYLPPEERVRIW